MDFKATDEQVAQAAANAVNAVTGDCAACEGSGRNPMMHPKAGADCDECDGTGLERAYRAASVDMRDVEDDKEARHMLREWRLLHD